MTEESKNRTELLRQYIDNRLDGEELERVEKKIASQKIWEEELRIVKREKALIKEAVKARLRQDAQHALKNERGKMFQMRIIRIAAAVIVLASAGFWYTSSLNSNMSLYTQYYETPQPSNARSSDTDELRFNAAMSDYSKRDFISMQEKLEELRIQASSLDQSKIEFFSAVGHLESGNFDEAINRFSKVSTTSSLFPDAQWYLALTLLVAERIEECKGLLTQIGNANHYKKQDAIDLLGKLNN